MGHAQINPELLDAMEDEAEAESEITADDPLYDGVSTLGQELEMLKEQMEELDREKRDLSGRYDELRKRVIPDVMRQSGMVKNDKGSFTTSSGARVSLRTDLHAGVRSEDKPRLFAWLRENGLGDLIREDVNAQTLKATIRERLEEGLPIPEYVTRHWETTATLTRAPNKKK